MSTGPGAQDIYGMDRNRTEEASSAPPSGGDGGAAEEGGMALDADAVECVICLTDPRVVAVYPCRHMCLCASCAEVLPSQGNKVTLTHRAHAALLLTLRLSVFPSFRAHHGLIVVPHCVACLFVCPGQCPICRRAAAMLLWIDNSSKRGAGAAAADDEDVDDDDDDDDDDEDDDEDDESDPGARPGAPAGAGVRVCAGSEDAQSTGSHGRLLQ